MKNLDISCIVHAAIFMMAVAADENAYTMRYSRIRPAQYRSPYSSGGNHRSYYHVLQRSNIIHRGSAAKAHGTVQKPAQHTSYGGTRTSPSRQLAPAPVVPTPYRSRNRPRSLKSSLVTTLRRYEKTRNKTELIRRVERILTNLPVQQKSVSYLRRSFSNFRQKNHAEFARLWSGLHETKRGVAGLQLQCTGVERNLTTLNNNLQRVTQNHDNNLSNVHLKLKQIEEHENIQDVRYFAVAEKGTNNSRELIQLKEEIYQQLRSIHLERDEVTQSLSRIQRRLHTIFNEELNQHRSALSQIEKTITRHEILLTHDETITTRRNKLSSINETMQNQEREIGDLNIKIRSLKQNVQDSDLNIYRLLKQERSRLSTIARLRSSVMRLNRSVQQTNFKESYLEAKVANLEEVLQRIVNHLNEVETAQFVDNTTKINNIVPERENDTNLGNQNMANNTMNAEIKTIERKPLVLNELNYVSTTTRDVMDAIEETGFEDRLDRMSRSLKHHSDKLTNVTDTMKSVIEDVRSLSLTTSNYFSIINEQAKTIRKQNETVAVLLHRFSHRESLLASHLEYQHMTVMKLMNIITSFAEQLRQPLQQHRDCHDLWMSGHMTSGVYTLVKNMEMMPVFCNMSDKGGWTTIQRRMDGTQDFNANFQEYKKGFGSVFGEYWFGLENIRWLTHGRIYSLRIILEDWGENQRYATYDQFLVYGNNFVLMVSGYNGDAGDALMDSNDVSFQARRQSRDVTITRNSDCTTTKQAGWWFPNGCGDANLNGPYPEDPRQAKQQSETNFLSEFMNPATQWMKWRSDDFPLKKVSMQIIPHEALIERAFSTSQSSQSSQEDSTNTNTLIVEESSKNKVNPSAEVDEELPVYSVRHVSHHRPET